MKRLKFLLAAGAGAVLLAACTHEIASLSLNPNYRLGYDDKGETVALAYGLPNSDDLALMLECPKGTGQIELTDAALDKGVRQIVLSSDGKKTAVAVHPEDGVGDQVLAGRLALTAPALEGFRRTGVLQVSGGKGRYSVNFASGGRAGVERFFRVCG
jgi:hypothetical protein